MEEAAYAKWYGQLLADHTAAKQAKRAIREQNRIAWSNDHRNSNYQRGELIEAIVPEVPEPADDTRPLDKLREIMLDPRRG